jgi:hypothetical protein
MYNHILEELQKVLQELDQIPVSGLATIKMANAIISLNELGREMQEKIQEEKEEENIKETK